MHRIFCGIAAIVLLGSVSQPAAADYFGAPWCAVVAAGDGDMQWHCEYTSVEECRPHVLAGNRGWCNPNPYFVGAVPSAERRHSHKRHARVQ